MARKTKKNIIVRGDRDKYGKFIVNLGGRWNPRMSNGEGWNVPLTKEQEIKDLISKLTDDQQESITTQKSITTSSQESLSKPKNRKEQVKSIG